MQPRETPSNKSSSTDFINGRQSSSSNPSSSCMTHSYASPGIFSPEASAAQDSSIMAAWPSHPAAPSKPHQKATASNNRPMDEVAGQWIFRAIIASRTSRFRTGIPLSRRLSSPSVRHGPIWRAREQAHREGSRTASSPPGRRNGLRRATLRGSPSSSNTKNSPPHTVPSVPNPVPSQAMPKAGNGVSFSTAQAST